MAVLFHIPVVLSLLLLAAHFLRVGNWGAVATMLVMMGAFFLRKKWMCSVLQVMLAGGVVFWSRVAIQMIQLRAALGEPWLRMAMIMGGVIILCGLSAALLSHRFWQRRFDRNTNTGALSTAAFFVTSILLTVVQLKVQRPMLLPERFLFGGGWLAVLLLGTYAAHIVEKLHDVSVAPVWRKRIWVFFALFFFGQFVVGILGIERFLMTGNLHVPIPAVILAGPIFRGEGFFMPILLASTLLLVGPAWCSHLCYFGGFDLLAAKTRRRPMAHPKWFQFLRIGMLAGIAMVALGLRWIGTSGAVAAGVAVSFGIVSIATMVFTSRRMGTMFHCSTVCPVGLVAVIAGKVSPFRMTFTPKCDGCGACGLSCPTGALEKRHILTRKTGINCTLCGDCLSKCKTGGLAYGYGPWRSPAVRAVFLVLVVSLHAVFLGVARV